MMQTLKFPNLKREEGSPVVSGTAFGAFLGALFHCGIQGREK